MNVVLLGRPGTRAKPTFRPDQSGLTPRCVPLPPPKFGRPPAPVERRKASLRNVAGLEAILQQDARQRPTDKARRRSDIHGEASLAVDA